MLVTLLSSHLTSLTLYIFQGAVLQSDTKNYPFVFPTYNL